MPKVIFYLLKGTIHRKALNSAKMRVVRKREICQRLFIMLSLPTIFCGG